MLANYPKVRLVLYLLSVATAVATAFVAVVAKDLTTAFVTATAILSTASTGTAVSNISWPGGESSNESEGVANEGSDSAS